MRGWEDKLGVNCKELAVERMCGWIARIQDYKIAVRWNNGVWELWRNG